MAEEARKDSFSRPTGADEHPHRDNAAEMTKPESPRDFTLRQETLKVPKPSYHEHVDDGAELGQPEEFEGEEWRGTEEHDPASDEAAASRRARSSRIRWWGLLLFILLYAVFKLVRFGP